MTISTSPHQKREFKDLRFEKGYQFFDNAICLKTNLEEIHTQFHYIYERLEIDPNKIDTKDFIIHFSPDRKELYISYENEIQILEQETITPNLYLYVFSFIIPRIRSHFLVHSATLRFGNTLSVIAANSTSGKTTLAVKLIKRGAQFLSDELAPINRNNHLIDPFPRKIGLRDLKIHGLESQAATRQLPNTKGEVKWMFDSSELGPGGLGQAGPLSQVIFLEPQYVEDSSLYLEVSITRLNYSLIEAIKQIPGIQSVELVNDRIFPLLRCFLDHDNSVIKQIEEAVIVYQSALVSVVSGKTQKPDFQLAPELKAMSKFEGTYALAKMLLNGHSEADLLDDFNGSPGLLLSELADYTAHCDFFQLHVGKLSTMTDIVYDLMHKK